MDTQQYQLREIWIYPVKSLGGVSLSSSKVLPKGLQFDRRFMLVDAQSQAITQREMPVLALFRVTIDNSELVIQYKDDVLRIPVNPDHYLQPSDVKIFDEDIIACEISSEFSRWFSRNLGSDVKLMFFPEKNSRPVDKEFQLNNEHVSLADAFPLLIIGQQSLNELNRHLDQPVPMNRFRPNFVFTGGLPFDEDNWKDFSLGSSEFSAVKPCGRCIVTTVEQETGIRGQEPLRALSKFRTKNNKVLFGQNVLVLKGAEVKTGDQILIKSYR